MNMEEIYRQASGVDIKEQERLWNERGKGYFGEYLVFSEVFPLCSEKAKLLTNVQIPFNEKSTEIDVLLIDRFGIVSFEVKHYKGTIYGKSDDRTWTQYFKTTKNEVFPSPILQNDYHVSALRHQFPDVPIYSIIVFTNQDVVLKISNNRAEIIVCTLYNLKLVFQLQFFRQEILSDQEIDRIFSTCSEWAPEKNNYVFVEGKEVVLSEYARTIAENVREEEKRKWLTRKSPLSIALSAFGAAAFAIGLFLMFYGFNSSKTAEKRIKEAGASVSAMSSEVSKMQAKLDRYFSTASWDNGGEIDLKDDFLEILDCVMEDSPDMKQGTVLSFTVKCNGTDFAVHINGVNELVLLLKDGRSVSGKLSDFTLNYIDSAFSQGKEYKLHDLLIPNVSPEEIQHIKLVGAEIVKYPETYLTVKDHYEIPVYNVGN